MACKPRLLGMEIPDRRGFFMHKIRVSNEICRFLSENIGILTLKS